MRHAQLTIPTRSAVAQKIRDLCGECNVTYAELSRRTGISQPAMGRWWRGEVTPSLSSRRLVARALGVPLSALIIEGEDIAGHEAISTNEATIESFLSSEDALDLSEDEARQLRLSSGWVPGHRPLSMREVRAMADLLRLRLREPGGGPKVLNLKGSKRALGSVSKSRGRSPRPRR